MYIKDLAKDFIDFKQLKDLFNPKEWDIAYVSTDNFEKGGHKPIKQPYNLTGVNWGEDLNANAYNGIILARYVEETNNYNLYEESTQILDKKFKYNYVQVYLNFKEVALLSGFAHRAKNSLVYNRKFGFQCKLCAYMFIPPIINYEKLKPSTELLDLCDGCYDCIKNCPVGAISEDGVDLKKCNDFLGWGNHPTIPSTKWFWYEKIGYKKYSREEVESWSSDKEGPKFEWGEGIDGNYELVGNDLMKDGKSMGIPTCKECVSQPRCSKAPVIEDQFG